MSKSLKEFCLIVHRKALAQGHLLRWNTNNPDVYVGTCDCGFKSEVTLDGKEELTEQGELKQCRKLANLQCNS